VTQSQNLSLKQTIEKVDDLIDSGKGDAGRLYHILEFLKNNKSLYRSDRIYLERKLNSSFSVQDEPEIENDLLPKIKKLIDTGNGDAGRLQYIYDAIANNKSLYRSDSLYLETKFNLNNADVVSKSVLTKPAPKILSPEKTKIILETKNLPKINEIMPKDWTPKNESDELNKITEDISDEEQKIKTQEKINEEINLQRSNLSQLISHRKEYEQKVTKEKSFLESQIKEERVKIETQTKLSNDIIFQKKELNKVKKRKTFRN